MGDLDLLGAKGTSSPRNNKGGLDIDMKMGSAQKTKKSRRQRSSSPGAGGKKDKQVGFLNLDIKMPTGPTDEEEADLQRAIAMSMAEAEAPKPESPPMKEQPKNMDTAADIRPFNPAVDDLTGPRNNA